MSQTGDFQKKSLIIFELNEFNEDLLETAAKQYDLKNILALLHYPKTQIKSSANNLTECKAASITPSERWESLHTGIEPSLHGITRLGPQYAPDRPLPYWETLLANDYTVGIWGAMNAKKPKKIFSTFFMPNLWQSKETAYPKILNKFIDLPRYVGKNYPSFAPDRLLSNIIKFILFIKNSGIAKNIILELFRLFSQLIHSTPRTLLFICFYDLISCMLFTAQLKKTPVHLSVFFVNSLAYLQHYYWKQGKWVTTVPLLHGLKIIDRIIGMLRQFEQTHHIILLNGLTQENRQHQPEKIIYKIKHPSEFFRYMGLSPISVDALSPQDGIIYFNSISDCEHAIRSLNAASCHHHPIFITKSIVNYPKGLYYKIVIDAVVNQDDFFELHGTEFKFFNYFKEIYMLTGSHHDEGKLYSRGIDFPAEITPEAFSQYVIDYYLKSGAQ